MIGFNPNKKDDEKSGAAPKPAGSPGHDEASLQDEATEPTVLKIPEGVDLKGKGVGDSVELLVKGTLKEGGVFVADSVNGIPLGTDKKEDQETEPAGFEDSIESGMTA